MMKTIQICMLAFAVFVSSAPTTSSTAVQLLGELVDKLENAVKNFPKETEGKQIFLTELQMNGCKHEVFCQAEQELKKVFRQSGAKFDHFQDKKFMRHLINYNKHLGETCKPVDEVQTEIPLQEFLPKLLKCVKKAYSQAKQN